MPALAATVSDRRGQAVERPRGRGLAAVPTNRDQPVQRLPVERMAQLGQEAVDELGRNVFQRVPSSKFDDSPSIIGFKYGDDRWIKWMRSRSFSRPL
jgi:hypothetical protein